MINYIDVQLVKGLIDRVPLQTAEDEYLVDETGGLICVWDFEADDESGILWDIDIAANGDLKLEDGYETNIIMSLFCDRRASQFEVLEPMMRRGWWGNTLNDDNFELGSKLWLLDQARLTTGTVRLAEQYAYDSLRWFKEDKLLSDISVSAKASFEADSPRIELVAEFLRKDNQVEYKYYTIWEVTGRKPLDIFS